MPFRLLLLTVLLFVPDIASAQWKRATSNNFIVYSRGSEAELRQFTSKVEAFDALLRVVSGAEGPPSPTKFTIYLLRNETAISKLSGKGIAGFYSPRLSGAVAFVPRTDAVNKYFLDGEVVLFHEYAHHFMMQYFATAYPPWYVEGFAEFYSTAEVSETGKASIGKPAYHRAFGLAMTKPFPVDRLLSNDPKTKTLEEGDAFYGRAWLLTHMLSFDAARKGQLGTYLNLYAEGVPPADAAVKAFGPIAVLEKDLAKYLKASRMSYRSLSGLAANATTIKVEPLGAVEDALFAERINFVAELSEKEQPGFVERVRKLAARYPDAPEAIDLLAEAELIADNPKRAAELDDRLLALKPDHGPALLRKAEALADKADEATDEKAHWRAVRELIVKANRANNDDTLALFRYYQSFVREGVKPSNSAYAGLLRAYELVPQMGEIRFALAQYLMREKRTKEARAVLRPMAYAPHGGEGAEVARRMIADIDGVKPPAPPVAEPPAEIKKP